MTKVDIANVLSRIGIALRLSGDEARAKMLLQEGLELSQEIDDLYLMAACLTGLVSFQQQAPRAAQVLGAAQTAFGRSGGFVDPLYRLEQARAENELGELFGMQDIAKFLEEGRTMAVEQAVALALEENQ
jgi:hypothetical protein